MRPTSAVSWVRIASRYALLCLGLPLLWTLAQPSLLSAQNDCGVDYSSLWRAIAQGTPAETHFFTRVTLSCVDGTVIYADSAIVSPPQRLSQWFGNVEFTEEGRVLKADRATYRTDIDRLDAFGNVSLVDSAGSELEGENLTYIRGGGNEEATELTMTGVGGVQPRALIVPQGSGRTEGSADGAESVEPYDVVADRIIIEGNEKFRGEGRVVVTRETLNATGRNMVYDAALGELLMVGDAHSEGDGYDLSGQSITVVLPNDTVEGVVARGDAALTTDDLDLTAPKIHIFISAEQLQRLVAAQLGPDDGALQVASRGSRPAGGEGEGDSRATALTQDFLLIGDSLDVSTPNEQLERVVAVGRARGDSFSQDSVPQPDTPDLARNDWLEGDTIVATFVTKSEDPLPVQGGLADSLAAELPAPSEEGGAARDKYALDRLVAMGNARSLYRMASSDTTGTVAPGRQALHYVVGDGITISMLDGEVDRMEVSGKTQGFHLEPVAVAQNVDSVSADSTAVDSAAVVDTTGVIDTTTVPDTLSSRDQDTRGRGRSPDSGVREVSFLARKFMRRDSALGVAPNPLRRKP